VTADDTRLAKAMHAICRTGYNLRLAITCFGFRILKFATPLRMPGTILSTGKQIFLLNIFYLYFLL
jgi:hypothetical protein